MAENGKRQRAENRERRRSQVDAPAPEYDESNGDGSDAIHQAARAAAAAAAVGAAVGAVRAIASRVDEHDEPDQDDAQQNEPENEPEQQDEPQENDQAAGDGEQVRDGDVEGPGTATEGSRLRHEGGTADGRQEQAARKAQREREPERPHHGASAGDAAAVVRQAREQLEALQGTAPESVSSLERIRDGWRVRLEVVEVHRVPDSTDVLAGYEVELDDDGGLLGYRRVERYYRSQAARGSDA